MRHAMHTTKESSRTADAGLDGHQVAVDPWRVIQFLERRRAETKRLHTPLDDLDPKLIELFSKMRRQIRARN